MNIVNLPIELDRKIFDSRFRLVAVASQAAKAMLAQNKGTEKGKKITIRAIEDAIAGRCKFLIGEEAAAALEAEKQKTLKTTKSTLVFDAADDLAKEVRKDLDSYLSTSTANTKTEEAEPPKPALSSVDEVDEVEK